MLTLPAASSAVELDVSDLDPEPGTELAARPRFRRDDAIEMAMSMLAKSDQEGCARSNVTCLTDWL